MLRLLIGLQIEEVFDRRVLAAIATASRQYGDTLLHLLQRDETFDEASHRYNVNGIILSSDDTRIVNAAVATGKRCVNVANHWKGHHKAPVVGTDDVEIGVTLAKYYVDRGFRNFACYTKPPGRYFLQRQRAFTEHLRERGFSCALVPGTPESIRNGESPTSGDWDEHLGKWLASLPKPLALMAPHDRFAQEAVQACQLFGVRVPAEVSVIGVDNDEMICSAIWPHLSSLDSNSERVAIEAFQLLRAMVLEGQSPPESPVLVPPASIVVRGSSSESAVDDPEVAAAVAFIRKHVASRVTVRDVVDHVLVSRRTLERRFFRALSRSVMETINQSRLEHAKRLLMTTDFSLVDVARRSGLVRQQRLCAVFRKDVGQTPREFRRAFRADP